MTTSIKQMLAEAEAAVPRLSPAQTREIVRDPKTVVVDVRDATEVAISGKLKGEIGRAHV